MWNPFQEPHPFKKKKKSHLPNTTPLEREVQEWSPPTSDSSSKPSSTLVPSKGPCGVCSTPSKARCGGCEAVFYCSKKHQATDWGKHRGVCRPISIPPQNPRYYKAIPTPSTSSGAGGGDGGGGVLDKGKPRWMTATREIPGGSTLFTEKPFIITPNPKLGEKGQVCLSCCRVGLNEMVPCTRCLLPICPHCVKSGHGGAGGVGGEECVAVAAAVTKNRGLMMERTGDPDRFPELVRDLSILKVLMMSRGGSDLGGGGGGGGGRNINKWVAFLGLRTNPRYLAQLTNPTAEVKVWMETEYSFADLYFRLHVHNRGHSQGAIAVASVGLKLEEVIRLFAVFSDVAPQNERLRVVYLLRSWIGHSCNPTAELHFHRSDPSLSIYLKSVEGLKDEGLIGVNFMDPSYSEGASKSAIRLWDKARLFCADPGCHCRHAGRVDASVGVRCGQIRTGSKYDTCPGFLAPLLDPPNPDKPHLGLLIYNKSKPWICNRCRRVEKFGGIMRPLKEIVDRMKALVEDYLTSPSPSKYPGVIAQLGGHLSDQHWLWVKINKVTLSGLSASVGEGKVMLGKVVRLAPGSPERSQFLGVVALKGELYGDGLYPNIGKGGQSGVSTVKGVLALEAGRRGRYSTSRGASLLDAFYSNLILFGEEWKGKLEVTLGGGGAGGGEGQAPRQTLASESVARWRSLLKLAQEASKALQTPCFSSPESRRQSETASELRAILEAAVSQGAPAKVNVKGVDPGPGKVDWVLEVMTRFMSRLYVSDTVFCSRVLPRLLQPRNDHRPDLLQRMFDPGSISPGDLTFGPAYGTGSSGSGDGIPILTLPEPELPRGHQYQGRQRQGGLDLDSSSTELEEEEEEEEEDSISSLDLEDFDLDDDLEDGTNDIFSAPLQYFQELLESTMRQRRATEDLLDQLLR